MLGGAWYSRKGSHCAFVSLVFVRVGGGWKGELEQRWTGGIGSLYESGSHCRSCVKGWSRINTLYEADS